MSNNAVTTCDMYSGDMLARFFGIEPNELRAWLSGGETPNGIKAVRTDVPRIADPLVPDGDMATAEDVCAFFRISKATLARWLIEDKLPQPEINYGIKARLWKVGTIRKAARGTRRYAHQ